MRGFELGIVVLLVVLRFALPRLVVSSCRSAILNRQTM
jgi:hypothetical protein